MTFPLSAFRPNIRAIPLVAALLLAGCGGETGPVLLVYSPHGEELLTYFEERFEGANPGVDVQFVDMGSQEVLDRIRSERANPQADVWWGAPAEVFAAGAEDGLLMSYRPTWADHIAQDGQGTDDTYFSTFLTPEVIAYNEEALTREEAPQDWDDILDPKWRDKVLIREPMASGTMRAIFGAIIYRESMGTGDPAAGYEWLLRLDAQTKEYTLNPSILYQKLLRQEGVVTLWTMPDIEIIRSQQELPLNYIIPASGTPIVQDAIAIVNNAPNLELAKAFVEMAGSAEAQAEAAELFFRIPARTDMEPGTLPDWLQRSLPLIKPMDLDQDLIREKTAEWMAYWDDNIRLQGRSEGY